MFRSNFLSYITHSLHGTNPFYRCVKSINYYYFGGPHVGPNGMDQIGAQQRLTFF